MTAQTVIIAITHGTRKGCRACPIAVACLQVAMTNEAGHSDRARVGIFGGLQPHQRARLARKGSA